MIFENVRNALAEQFEVDAETITMETSLIDDLGADSLALVELVMSVEEEFEIEIQDEDMEKFKTVGDVLDYIEK